MVRGVAKGCNNGCDRQVLLADRSAGILFLGAKDATLCLSTCGLRVCCP